MQIFIKSLSGKTITLDVDPYESIISIKNKIQIKENVSIENQKLIYINKILRDDKTLKDYDIFCESTLYLVLSLL